MYFICAPILLYMTSCLSDARGTAYIHRSLKKKGKENMAKKRISPTNPFVLALPKLFQNFSETCFLIKISNF